MTLSRDEKIELARHRMAKAASLLADGETLLRASSFASSRLLEGARRRRSLRHAA